jgi:hypothetical protein
MATASLADDITHGKKNADYSKVGWERMEFPQIRRVKVQAKMNCIDARESGYIAIDTVHTNKLRSLLTNFGGRCAGT